MPSADSRLHDGLALRFAHSNDPPAIASIYSCSFPYRSGSSVVGTRCPPMPGFFFTGLPNNPVAYSDDLTRDAAGLPG